MQKELDAQVRELLEKTRGAWKPIASDSKVSYNWMLKFMAGEIRNPGINTLRAIVAHFKTHKKASK